VARHRVPAACGRRDRERLFPQYGLAYGVADRRIRVLLARIPARAPPDETRGKEHRRSLALAVREQAEGKSTPQHSTAPLESSREPEGDRHAMGFPETASIGGRTFRHGWLNEGSMSDIVFLLLSLLLFYLAIRYTRWADRV
jgi:hypothetical protein